MKKIDKGTVYRTILQVAVYINQLIALLGATSFATSPIYQWATFIVTVIITGVTYWYNNDWTKGAKLAGEILDMFSDKKLTKEEIEEFIDNHKNESKE